jgi:hypothetical protein
MPENLNGSRGSWLLSFICPSPAQVPRLISIVRPSHACQRRDLRRLVVCAYHQPNQSGNSLLCCRPKQRHRKHIGYLGLLPANLLLSSWQHTSRGLAPDFPNKPLSWDQEI